MKGKKLLILALVLAILAAALAVGVAASDEPTEVKLSIESRNLSFEESVHILYAVYFEGVDAEDIQMLYWTTPFDDESKYTKDSAEYSEYGIGNKTVKGKKCRIFENSQMWAKNMTDVIYARAYVKVGGVEYYSDVQSYSILEYAYNQLGHTGNASPNENLKKLLEELLEYGAKAQGYFDHKTDHLPTDSHGKVEVEGGKLPDGMHSGMYKKDTEVTLTAITTPEAPYVKWVDETGKVISYENTVTVKVGDMTTHTYTAICYALYDVKFVDSDGTVISTECDLLLGDEFAPPVMEEREGYTFLGWAITEDGDAVYSPDTTSIVMGADNTDTYYAVWLPDEVEGTAGLEYTTQYDDGGNLLYYIVTGYTGTATEVVVGNTYNGYPVKIIDGNAFANNESITKVTVCDGIERLSTQAFMGCTALTTVKLPETLTVIGQNCFWGCTSLESVTLHEGLVSIGAHAFYNCQMLSDITLPKSLTTLEYSAFTYCTSLKSVTLSDNITVIAERVFSDCSSLESVTLGSKVTSIEYAAFNGTAITEITLPDTLTVIGNSAFSWCTALTAVSIPDSVKSIGRTAFYQCSALTVVEIGTGVETVAAQAFDSCTILNSVNITDIDKWYLINFEGPYANPLNFAHDLKVNGVAVTEVVIADGTEYIGSYAFAGLTTLTKVTIPESVKTIGEGAFYSCKNLTNTVLPSDITEIAKYTFCGCSTITEVTVPDAVTVIGDYAFNGCEALAKVRISENSKLATIGSFAFSSSTKLTDITLPSALRVIGEGAFLYCYNLTQIVIPDGVTAIYADAFNYCTSLRRVYIPDSVTVMGYYVFANCSGATVFVEAESAGIEWNSSWCPSDSLIIWGYEKTGTTEDGIEYALGKDGAAILGYTGDATELTIPDTIEGKAVFAIAAHAFENQTELVSVDIPATVTYIGEYAFRECTGLTEIVIPDGVTAIRQQTFDNCYRLKSVTLGTGVKSIGEIAFNNCNRLTSIVLPEGLESIGWCAFGACHSLTEIVIPESVTVIEGFAFNGITGLTIYAEAESQPEGWDPDWNANDYTVVWGYKK